MFVNYWYNVHVYLWLSHVWIDVCKLLVQCTCTCIWKFYKFTIKKYLYFILFIGAINMLISQKLFIWGIIIVFTIAFDLRYLYLTLSDLRRSNQGHIGINHSKWLITLVLHFWIKILPCYIWIYMYYLVWPCCMWVQFPPEVYLIAGAKWANHLVAPQHSYTI